MKKTIFILGLILLTASITMSQRCRRWLPQGENYAHYDQRGMNNHLCIDQIGYQNQGYVYQKGIDQHATIDQLGRYNLASITQGRRVCAPCAEGNHATIIQRYHGNMAYVYQWAKGGTINVYQSGFGPEDNCNKSTGNYVNLTQDAWMGCIPWCIPTFGCYGNMMDVSQTGHDNSVWATQYGAQNILHVIQTGHGQMVDGCQIGKGNMAHINQHDGAPLCCGPCGPCCGR